MAGDISQSDLNLSSEEKRFYGQLFNLADTESLGVVTGDIAVKFFERTKLDASILGEIWQIADTENRGLLTPAGFSVALRLIGHCQAGKDPSPAYIKRPGPLPWFEGVSQGPSSPNRNSASSSSPAQGPVRVPPLSPEKVAEYSILFERTGAQNGLLSGDAAKQVLEKAQLPNEILGRIWNLSDTQQRGALSTPDFVIAMHLLTSVKNGSLRNLPTSLPPGLYEAASRRSSVPPPQGPLTRNFSGQSDSPVAQSPLARGTVRSPPPQAGPSESGDWLISPQEKNTFDNMFSRIDTSGTGFMNGDQAVSFFSASGLSEDALAQVWDLADIDSDGRLNKDEFAVAMYLIRQQRGKKDDRGSLPSALPARLIPPSMRHKSLPPSHPTAPAFDNAAIAPKQPQPKSAADDLFGLDALAGSEATSSPQLPSAPASPQVTGTVRSPPVPAAATNSTGTSFKPFMPTSSFGQSLAPQSTGMSSSGSGKREVSAPGNDDLLGDNDPEISNKLTAETSELANMSNQIGTLRTQMQEVQTKKSTTQADLAASNEQKRDLEARLAQFRTQYEQEIREVKTLEEQLSTSRADTKKSQQELAMIDGVYQDLRTKHQEIAAALAADQKENAALKEQVRVLNAEVTQLKPQLEKLKSDARQQKGLVAINKKQVATTEGERDKLKEAAANLEKSNAEAAAAYQKSLQEVTTAREASPAPSAGGPSTNPFFRQASQSSVDRVMSPSIFTEEFGKAQDARQAAFDNFFGASAAAGVAAAPAVGFINEESHRQYIPSAAESPTPVSTPPPFSTQEITSPAPEPPAPPESRQITSSALPLRTNILRTDSMSSSVKANPPVSRGGPSPSMTPSKVTASPATSIDGSNGASAEEVRNSSAPISAPSADLSRASNNVPKIQEAGATPLAASIPGAFPGDTPMVTPLESPPPPSINAKTASEQDVSTPRAEVRSNDPFTETKQAGNTNKGAEHLGVGSSEATSSSTTNINTFFSAGPGGTANRSHTEFPPIEELQPDDSDSDSEGGFADNFTSASPRAGGGVVTGSSVKTAEKEAISALPPVTAQQSPPSYQDSQPIRANGDDRETNQFPPEFGGLLPSREMVGHPPEGANSPPQLPAAMSTFPTESAAISQKHENAAASTAGGHFSKPAAPVDEFDAAFDDLDEAREADEGATSAFHPRLSGNHDEHEFNPVFDSPAPSKAPTMEFQTTPSQSGATGRAVSSNSFNNFESSLGSSTSAFYGSSSAGQSAPQAPSAHDWDAIFSGLDKDPEFEQKNANSTDPFAMNESSDARSNVATVGRSQGSSLSPYGNNGRMSAAAKKNSPLPRPPAPARGISASSEHDDPILKNLTSMGYKRDDALQALEKYDYNIDRAVDYLSFKK